MCSAQQQKKKPRRKSLRLRAYTMSVAAQRWKACIRADVRAVRKRACAMASAMGEKKKQGRWERQIVIHDTPMQARRRVLLARDCPRKQAARSQNRERAASLHASERLMGRTQGSRRRYRQRTAQMHHRTRVEARGAAAHRGYRERTWVRTEEEHGEGCIV